MSSLDIAKLTGKNHKEVLRDIRKMFNELGAERKTALSDYTDITGRKLPMYLLDESETLCISTGYSIELRMRLIKQWQAMRDALDNLRYRVHDKTAQKQAMAVIYESLPPAERSNKTHYIAANCVVDKLVSDMYGFPKMLKKGQMSTRMLEVRTTVLSDYEALFKFGFDNHKVKQLLRDKYIARLAA